MGRSEAVRHTTVEMDSGPLADIVMAESGFCEVHHLLQSTTTLNRRIRMGEQGIPPLKDSIRGHVY